MALPVPDALAADLVESLDYPMRASTDGLALLVPDPPGGLVGIEDAVARSLANSRRAPVNALADPHHLADTDPDWAGGDVPRIQHLAAIVTPAFTRPTLGLFNAMPGPAAAWLRTGLDMLISLAPRGSSRQWHAVRMSCPWHRECRTTTSRHRWSAGDASW